MDRLQRILGMLDDNKRIYHVEAGEVDREEFHVSTLMWNYLFDDQIGVVATLGPTWNMVHDPRFTKIENCFVYKRRPIFKGDTTVGVGHISRKQREHSDPQALEQLATILGEGRHFRKQLLETEFKDEEGDPCHPKTFYQESDAVIWRLVKQECPNYFTLSGKPNREATQLYNLLKEDLLGLVDDYAEIPAVDEMVNMESGEVWEQDKWDNETPIVNLEIDQLEKALHVRAELRLTAWAILERLGFADKLKDETRLTDAESDELLRIIYTSNWPDGRTELAIKIMLFIERANQYSFEERQKEQLALASEDSKGMINQIKTGERVVLNRFSDPGESLESLDPEAAITLSIQTNPYKRDLFMLYSWAETQAPFDKDCKKVVELLEPVFQSTSFDMTEDVFKDYLRQVRSIMDDLPSIGMATLDIDASHATGDVQVTKAAKMNLRTLEGFYDGTTPVATAAPAAPSELNHAEGCGCWECNPKFGPGEA